MFDATGDGLPKRLSQLQQTYTEKRAFANRLSYRVTRLGIENIAQIESVSFTAPKLMVTLLLRDFVLSL